MKKRIAAIGIGFLANLLVGAQLFSNPTGAHVAAGDVHIDDADAHHLTVESWSDRAIVEWDSFSIDNTESAYFQLPDSSSVILNRVRADFPSILSGHLFSNGSVYLVNPSGVIVTEEGRIDTGSFLASTFDVGNEAFLLGSDLVFAGTSQEAIINKGKITAWNGDVFLLGYHVRNENMIEAKEGVAALGCGSEILLTLKGQERISVAVSADVITSSIGIEQLGAIEAMQIELKAAGSAYALAVQNKGFIHATAAAEKAGRVYLIAEGGYVSHTGEILAYGGDVQILGEGVALSENAVVDVSGDFGGGSILVGGDYKRQNPNIITAEHTYIEDGVFLKADARVSGSGGKIIVWGIENSLYFGSAFARGAGAAGSGGLIEVSSTTGLFYKGIANTLAENGSRGMLLLDPTDFVIGTTATTTMLAFGTPTSFADTYSGAYDGTADGSPFATFNILTSDLLNQLMMTNVTVDASQGTGAGAGSITINVGDMPLDTTGLAHDLTFIALTNVVINAPITHGGSGAFKVYSGAFNEGGATPIFGLSSGTITSNAGITIDITGTGSFFLDANGPVGMDGIIIQGPVSYTGSGGATFQTEVGNVHFSGATGTLTASGTMLPFTVNADGEAIFDSTVLVDMAGSLDVTANASILFNNASTITFNSSGTSTFTPGALFTFIGDGTNILTVNGTGSGTVTFAGSTALQNSSIIHWQAGSGTLVFSGDMTTANGSTMTFDAMAGGLTVAGVGFGGILNYGTVSTFNAISSSPFTVDTTGVLTFNGGGTVNIALTGSGAVTLNNTGVNSFAISGTTDLTLSTVDGDITMGPSARMDYSAGNSQIIQTTGMGSVNFDGSSLINFVPSALAALTVQAIGSGNVGVGSIVYGPANTGLATLASTSGSVTVNNGGTLTFLAGAGALDITAASGVVVDGAINYASSSGDLDISVSGGNVEISATGIITMDGSPALNIDGNLVTLNGGISSTGGSTGTVTITAAADIVTAGTYTFDGTGDVTFASTAGNINFQSATTINETAGNLIVNANGMGGSISHAGILNFSSGAGKTFAWSANNGISLGNINNTASDISNTLTTANGDIDLSSTDTVTSSGTAGNLVLTASNGNININGNLNFSSGDLIGVGNGNFNLNQNAVTITGASRFDFTASTGSLSFNPSTLTQNSSAMTNSALIASAGGVTISGAINFSGGTSGLIATSNTDLNINASSFDYAASNNATFQSTTGGLFTQTSVHFLAGSGNLSLLAPAGAISVGGPMVFDAMAGGLTMHADLYINVGSAITYNSGNPLLIQSDTSDITGNEPLVANSAAAITYSAGQDFLLVDTLSNSGSGALNISATGIFRVEPALGSQGNIAWTDTINISGVGMMRVFGNDTTALITSVNGPIGITTIADAFFLGNAEVDSGTGAFNFSIGGSLNLLANANTIVTGSSGVVAITDNLFILADSGGLAEITAAGNVTVSSTSGGIYLVGFSAANTSSINSTGGGIVTVQTLGPSQGNIVVRDFSNITTTGNIIINSQGDVIVDNSSRIDNSAGAGSITIGTVVSPILGDVVVSGGVSGPGQILSGTGGIAMQVVNSIHSFGISAANNGQIIAADGGLSLTTTINSILFDNFAAVTLSAGANPLALSANLELLIADGSAITNSGTGTMTLTTASGSITLSADQSGALVQGSSGLVTVQSASKLSLISGSSGSAEILTAGDLSLSAADEITFSGLSGQAASAQTTTGSLGVIASKNLNLLDNSNITITGAANANALTISVTNDLALIDFASINHQGTGDVSVTVGGNADVHAGVLGASFIQGLSTMSIGVTGVLGIQAASGFEGYLMSNGLTSVTSGALNLFGNASMVRAHITNGTGDLTVTSGLTTLNNHSAIELTGGTGNMLVMLSDDLIITDDSIIQNSSTGTLGVATSVGSITLLGGAGNALITGSANTTTVTAAGSVFVISDPTGFAGINNAGDLSVTAAGGSVYVIGSPDGTKTSSINSTAGAASISALSDIVLENSGNVTVGAMSGSDITLTTTNGSLLLMNDAFIDNLGTGNVLGTINKNALIMSGSTNESFIRSTALVTLGIGGNLDIQALSGNAAFISSSSGAMTAMVTAGKITLVGESAMVPAQIINATGPMTIAGSNVDLNSFAFITVSAGAGALTVNSTGDLRVANASLIQHLGTGALNSTITDTLFIEAGALGNAAITSLTGGAVISANSVFLDGYSDGMTANTGSISAAGGGLGLTSTIGAIALNQHAFIHLTGGTAAMSIIAADDMLIANDAFIENDGTGTTSISTVSGSISLLAGAGNALITGSANTTTVTAAGSVFVISDPTGFAEITNAGDLSVTAAGGSVYVIGSPDGTKTSSINSTAGAASISALSDIVLENSGNVTAGVMSGSDIALTTTNGDLILNNDAFINNLGSGNIVGTIGGNSLVLAGAAGPSFIESTAIIDLTIGGDLDIQALSGNAAFISANSNMMTTAIAADRITLIGQTALASATITNISGTMTVTGTYIDLSDNAQISVTSGSGALTITASNDVAIANASSLRNLGMGLLSVTATDTLYIEAGPLGTATIAGGSGGVTVSANSAFLTGYADGMSTNTASITAFSGAYNVTTTFGTLSLNQHASMLLSSGAAAMTVTVANGLLVANDAAIRNLGTGTTTLNVTGTATFLASAADARLQGNSGALTLTASDDIRILSSANGQAAIMSAGQAMITATGDILLEGSTTGAKQSLIQTTTNALSVIASQNVNLLNNARIAATGGAGTLTVNATNGTLTVQNQSSIQHAGTGFLSFNIGANALISAGPNGNAFIQSSVGLNLDVNGALAIQSQSNAGGMSSFTGFIQAAGNTTITAGKISMTGLSSSFQAYIKNSSGTLSVSTTNGSIDMQDEALIQLAAAGTVLTVNTVGGNLRISNGSSIENLGTMATNSSISGTLMIEGGPLGLSAFKGGVGAMTVSANAIQMNGFSSAFNALLTATQGSLSISSTGATNLSQNATISISSAAASSLLQVTAGNDLLVTNNSIIRNFGTGALNLTVTAGAMNILAGSGNATVQSGSGGININVMLDNLNILSDRTGTASVATTGNVAVAAGQNVTIVGAPGGSNSAFIQTGSASNPTLSVTATGILSLLNGADIAITSGSGTLSLACTDLWIENKSFVQQQGTGIINSMISGDVVIMAGPAGAASIQTNAALTLNVTGDLRMIADANGVAQISTKGATNITAGRVHMLGFSASIPSFAALITNTTGNLSISATAIDLIDFAQIQLTGGSGTLALSTTTSDLRIANGSFVQNSGTGPTTANVNDIFFIEAGQVGSSRFTGGIGGMAVTANAAMLTGFSTGNRAQMTTASGGLSVTTASTVNLTPYATISQTSTMGASAMDITAGTDLLISDGSIISNLGMGSLTVSAGRSIELLGGQDNAVLQSGGGLTISAADNIHVISNSQGFSEIIAVGNISITSATMMPAGGGSIYVTGAPQASLNGIIQSTNGSISLTAYKNIIVQDLGGIAVTSGSGTIDLTTTTGDLVVQNGSSISGLTGTLTGSINKNAVIRAGSSGNAFISNTGLMNLTIGADLDVEAPAGTQAYISCNGDLSSISAGRIYMEGSSAMQYAYLENGTGSFSISAQSIHLLDFSRILLNAGAGAFSVTASSGELRLANGALIQNSGTGLTTVSASSSTLYVEGGSSSGAQTAIKGGSGGLTVNAVQILMNGFSAANNALMQAANGTMDITTSGMLNMTPNSKIQLVAGAGMLNVTSGGNFYRTTATSTITAPTVAQVNLVVTGTSCTSCM